MYKEYLVTSMRSNIQDEVLMEIADLLNIKIRDDFIEDIIFHGCQGQFTGADYGAGELYIFKSTDSEALLLVNTYLNPRDQLDLV